VFYWWTPPKTANGRFLFILVRGDLDINEVKLRNALGGGDVRPATDDEIRAAGAEPGYASPIGLNVAAAPEQPGLFVLADPSIEAGGNFVVGANDTGYHYTGANYPRDFDITQLADLAQADTGHQCPRCGGRIEARRCVEVGHCFKLGTRYSLPTGANYLDENGRPQPIFMGSYGIGLDRLMATIVELHHDADGIIWPESVAPYRVHLMHIGKGDEVRVAADQLYDQLRAAGISVLYDDREAMAGVKFKDADLIGLPWRVMVGARSLAEGSVEVKRRSQAERVSVGLTDLVAFLQRSD
jgi:prolyl-tRNA synthetase